MIISSRRPVTPLTKIPQLDSSVILHGTDADVIAVFAQNGTLLLKLQKQSFVQLCYFIRRIVFCNMIVGFHALLLN